MEIINSENRLSDAKIARVVIDFIYVTFGWAGHLQISHTLSE